MSYEYQLDVMMDGNNRYDIVKGIMWILKRGDDRDIFVFKDRLQRYTERKLIGDQSLEIRQKSYILKIWSGAIR